MNYVASVASAILTIYNLESKYRSMSVNETQRLKKLIDENRQVK